MKKILFFLILFLILIGCNIEDTTKNETLEKNQEIDDLILKLSDDNYDIRKNASNKLTDIGEKAVPYIIESLKKDPYYNTSSASFNSRWNKVNVLGRIGSNKSEDILIDRILFDEETHVRWRSIWALNLVKSSNTPKKILNYLENQEEKIRWRAAVVLGTLYNEQSKEVLLRGLTNQDDWIKWEAVYVLGILNDPSTANEISKLLKDNSTRIRQETALTLGKLENKEIIPKLLEALEDESPGVRWRAASSLSKLKDKSVIPEIEKALKKEQDSDAHNYINKALENLKSE